jgi:hypothetical protein
LFFLASPSSTAATSTGEVPPVEGEGPLAADGVEVLGVVAGLPVEVAGPAVPAPGVVAFVAGLPAVGVSALAECPKTADMMSPKMLMT